MIRLWEILFLAEIVEITKVHADRFKFKANISIGFLFHATWMVIYFIPPTILILVYHSWWLAVASASARFIFYNPILNAWRKEKFFYLHSGENGSWWDKIELKWGKAYPYVWAAGIILFGVLQLNRFL